MSHSHAARLIRAFTYWGLLKHPFGREYARAQYGPLGGTTE